MRRLQQLLDELVDAGAAGVLMHYHDQDGQWRGSRGVAELGTDRPVDPDGWFRIGSVTKTFTAAVVLSLVRDGLVTLDDTCEQWLPGLVPGASGITVLQLLNHTSGLYNYTEDLPDPRQIVLDRYKHWEPKQAIEMATAHAPVFEPGRLGRTPTPTTSCSACSSRPRPAARTPPSCRPECSRRSYWGGRSHPAMR
jgi:D-alanyl-D-alanine carboxypeptidase